MNDYYSQFPQPPLETRINQAIDGIPDYLKSSISTKKLNKIVREVVSNAPEYSLTGYRVSGLSDCISQIIKDIEVERKKANTCIPF